MRRFLEIERDAGLRLLTSSAGPVQPRAVAAIAGLIEAEVRAGAYRPAVDTGTLAYAIVRLFEAFVYNDAAIGIRGDIDRLREVELAAVLARARAAARLRDRTFRAGARYTAIAASICAARRRFGAACVIVPTWRPSRRMTHRRQPHDAVARRERLLLVGVDLDELQVVALGRRAPRARASAPGTGRTTAPRSRRGRPGPRSAGPRRRRWRWWRR